MLSMTSMSSYVYDVHVQLCLWLPCPVMSMTSVSSFVYDVHVQLCLWSACPVMSMTSRSIHVECSVTKCRKWGCSFSCTKWKRLYCGTSQWKIIPSFHRGLQYVWESLLFHRITIYIMYQRYRFRFSVGACVWNWTGERQCTVFSLNQSTGT